MDEDFELNPDLENVSDAEQAMGVVDATLDRFLDAASVDMVYGEPILHGETLIIPSAELLAVLGFGVGAAYGMGPAGKPAEGGEQAKPADGGSGGGGGGGGGGRIFSRPVAVIVASPEGVVVQPIVDKTKIALAALTAAGFMFSLMARMRRPLRE